MPIVSNTSPILNLAIVDHLHLLRDQFEQILIPPIVLDELMINEDRPGSRLIREAVLASWIKVQDVKDDTLIQLLKQTLDDGEAAAIALASELQASLILLDERDGRKIAKSLGLNVTGILGILLRAKQNNSLESIHPIIEKLTIEAGFRIAPDLLTTILNPEA